MKGSRLATTKCTKNIGGNGRKFQLPYRPKLNPEVDLEGATPEALACALLRRTEPLPTVGKSVAGGEVKQQEIASDQSGNGVRAGNR